MTPHGLRRRLLVHPARSLEARIVVSFAGLALVVLLAVASVAFVMQRRSLEAAAFGRLEAVAAVKDGEIDRWISSQRDQLVLLAGLESTRGAAAGVAAGGSGAGTGTRELQRLVQATVTTSRELGEVFVLARAGGRVVASSDATRLGVFHLGDLFFERGKEGTFVQDVYPSPVTGRPTLTVATPVRDDDGTVVAVLAAHLRLERLDEILAETSAVGATARAYAVSRTSDVVSSERFGLPELRRGIHTVGVERALAGERGRAAYRNVEGRPVLGAYRWMEAREMGLVLEMDRAEALAPVRASLLGILLVGSAATLVLLLGVARIGRRVAHALAAVTSGAARVAGGSFTTSVEAEGADELGELARAFNAMTAQLEELYGDLQGQVERNEEMLIALEEGRAFLEAIVQNSSALIAVYHPASGVVLANRALEAALGLAPDALIGRGLVDVLPPAQARIHRDARERALAGNRTVEGELRLEVEGEERTYFAVWFPLRDLLGTPFGVGLIATDISERDRYEARLRHSQKLESLGVLAGGIAHDFNNLLAAILGHADLALETLEPASEGAQHLGQVVQASRRAATLTNQLLSYAGRASLRVEVLDLNQVVEEVWSLLSVSMGKKVVLERRLDTSPCWVRADPAQVSQVVMNLVTNAGQAIGDVPGTVEVRTRREILTEPVRGVGPGRFVRLTVTDTGCGMDEQTLERIFDPFFTTKESGRGLGLAAVIGIVNGLGGGLHVESAVGRGTTFDIRIPEAAAAGGHGTADEERQAGFAGARTILLADDEEAVRGVARRSLERAGHTVVEARDGEEALRLFRDAPHRFHAAVLDISMPGLGGAEVFEEIRRLAPDLPVVFTSGYDPSDAVRGLDARGGVRFLQKPFRPRELAALVGEALAGGAAAR